MFLLRGRISPLLFTIRHSPGDNFHKIGLSQTAYVRVILFQRERKFNLTSDQGTLTSINCLNTSEKNAIKRGTRIIFSALLNTDTPVDVTWKIQRKENKNTYYSWIDKLLNVITLET